VIGVLYRTKTWTSKEYIVDEVLLAKLKTLDNPKNAARKKSEKDLYSYKRGRIISAIRVLMKNEQIFHREVDMYILPRYHGESHAA